MVNTMKPLLPKLITSKQGAFVGNQNILDNIPVIQEFMYDLIKASYHKSFITIKIDMERAYDCMSMSWRFMKHTLLLFDFYNTWIRWMLECIQRSLLLSLLII